MLADLREYSVPKRSTYRLFFYFLCVVFASAAGTKRNFFFVCFDWLMPSRVLHRLRKEAFGETDRERKHAGPSSRPPQLVSRLHRSAGVGRDDPEFLQSAPMAFFFLDRDLKSFSRSYFFFLCPLALFVFFSVCLAGTIMIMRGGLLCVRRFSFPQVMHAGPQHQALLPAAETPKPWETVVAATYANLKNVPVLFSRSATGEKGRWVCPGEAVVVEEVEQDGGGGAEERVEHAKRLTKVLCCAAYFYLFPFVALDMSVGTDGVSSPRVVVRGCWGARRLPAPSFGEIFAQSNFEPQTGVLSLAFRLPSPLGHLPVCTEWNHSKHSIVDRRSVDRPFGIRLGSEASVER